MGNSGCCCYNKNNINNITIIVDANMYLTISKDFLKYTCNIEEKYLDKEGYCLCG